MRGPLASPGVTRRFWQRRGSRFTRWLTCSVRESFHQVVGICVPVVIYVFPHFLDVSACFCGTIFRVVRLFLFWRVRLSSVLDRGQTYVSPDTLGYVACSKPASPMDTVYVLNAAVSAVTQHFQFGYILGCLLVVLHSSSPRIPQSFILLI